MKSWKLKRREKKLIDEVLEAEKERKKLSEYTPGTYNADLKAKQKAPNEVRIGLFGPAGAGKSALINTAISAFENVTPRVVASVGHDGIHGTLEAEDYAVTSCVKLSDIRGFEFMDTEREKIHVKGQIKGTLPQHMKLVKNTDLGYSWWNNVVLRLSTIIPKYEKCQVVFFTISLEEAMNSETYRALRILTDTVRKAKIKPLIVLTHMDKVTSDRTKEKRVEISKNLNVDRNHVVAISSYHLDEDMDLLGGFERNHQLELRVLRLLNLALVLADDRLKFL